MRLKYRSVLTASVFATAFIGLSGGAAYSQKATFLEPSASWAVSKLGDGGGAYCALARQFEQNTILTLARNGDEETSFALDFQRPVFATGQNLNIVLDPGAGQQRAYQVTPASPQAFVARMGRDGAFFNALEKTGFLRVNVSGKNYHFNIADVQSGQSKLDSCLVSMVMPAAGDEMEMAEALTPAPVSAGQSDEPHVDLSNFRQEINSLRNQVINLRKQNQELSAQAGSGDSQAQVEMLNKRIENLSVENKALQNELANAQAPKAVQVRPEVAGAGSEALRQENLRLKAELQTLIPESDRIAEYEGQIRSLEQDNARLTVSLQDQKNLSQDVGSRTAQLEARIRDLEAQNAQLNQDIALAQASPAVATQSGAVASDADMDALRAENETLKAQLASASGGDAKMDELRRQLAELEAENQFLEETSAQIKTDLAQAHNLELDSLKAQLASARAAPQADIQEMAELKLELDRLKADNAAHLVKIAENADLSSQIGDLQQSVEALQAEKSTLQAQLDDMTASADSEGGEIASLREENAALKDLNTQLSERVAVLEAENTALESRVADALARVDVLTSDNAALSALQAENQEMLQSLARSEAAQEDLQGQLNTAQSQNDALKESLEEVIALAETYQEKSAAAVAGNDMLDAAQARIASLEGDMSALQAQNELLETELLQSSRISTREQASVDAEQEQALQKKIAMLQDQLEMVKRAKARELAEVQRQYAMLEKRVYEQSAAVKAAPPAEAVIEAQAASAPPPVQQPAAASIPPQAVANPQVAMRPVEPVIPPEDLAGLNQAQIQEKRLRARLARDGGQAQAMLQASAKQDPFEDIEVTPEQAFADVVSEDQRPDAESISRVADADVRSAPGSADALMGVDAIPDRLPSLAGVTSDGVFQPGFDVQSVLQAGSALEPGSFKRVDEASDSERVAYQWMTPDRVFASAEQRAISGPAQFDVFVMEYIERTQSRCPGDFAVSPDQTSGDASTRVDSYEVACVADGVSSSASLLFFTRNGTFTTMAYEAPTNKLMNAMDRRNDILQIVQDGSGGWTLASR